MVSERIDVIFSAKAEAALAKIDAVNKAIEKSNRLQANNAVKASKAGKTIVRAFNKASTEVIKFNGNMLSLLFFGMEIKRVFGGALKSIFEGYKKIIPEGHEFNRLTTKLSANWEFFKFQLADALATSPLFQKLVMGAIKAIKYFQNLSETSKLFIVIGLAIMTVVGALLMYIGLISLGISSVINMAAVYSGWTAAATLQTGTLNAALAMTITWMLRIVAILGILTFGYLASSNMINNKLVDDGEKIRGFWKNMLAIGNTFIAGLINIFILTNSGVIMLFTGVIDAFNAMASSIVDSAASFGRAIKAAIRAGLTGGFGDAKAAFLKEFNFASIGETFADNFSNAFSDGLTSEVAKTTQELTQKVNNWNKDYIDKLSEPINTQQDLMTQGLDPQYQQWLNDANNQAIANISGQTPQPQNNYYIELNGEAMTGTKTAQSLRTFIDDFDEEFNSTNGI